MPATLTALMGVAVHGARRAEADPTELQRAATMLVTASGARRLTWVLRDGTLLLNDIPIAADSPGASLLAEAMASHGASAIRLPAGLTLVQWNDLAGILASAPGIYPTPDHLRAAVGGVVPGATLEAHLVAADEEEVVEESNHDTPGSLRFAAEEDGHDPALVSTEADRADLSGLLDPLLDAGREAVAKRDYSRLAEALLGLQQVADRGDGATAAIVNQERRRVVPAAAVETLVRLLPRVGAGSPIARALMHLGREGAEAILDVLASDPPRSDRRILLEVLGQIAEAPAVLVVALGSPQAPLVRDAAEVLGRMGVAGAVPTLAALLRHGDQDVRAAAWHALETIGTPDALAALRTTRH